MLAVVLLVICFTASTMSQLAQDSVLDLHTYDDPALSTIHADPKWTTAVATGGKLQTCMLRDDKAASWFFRTDPSSPDPNLQTIQSPFDGNMVETFKKWGYSELAEAKIDKECDFDLYHHVKPAFEALGIGTKSKGGGGPNWCMQVDHFDGEAVVRNKEGKLPEMEKQVYVDASCGKEYRITGATFQFSINAEAGMITLLNVMSPAYSAARLWGRKPATHELPHIRSISDVAWGLWNRASPENLKNINYFMAATIINDETRSIIRQAHEMLDPKRTETEKWPGYDFVLDDDVNKPAGRALMGSPVGRWAAYFLMQHKTQLGGNKYISKIRIFKPEAGFMPYMLFYVSGPAPANPGYGAEPSISERITNEETEGSRELGVEREVQVIEDQKDRKHVLTEHIVRAKL